MSRRFEKSNEAQAIFVQRGYVVIKEKAIDFLLRCNEGLIYDKALTYWKYSTTKLKEVIILITAS